MDTVWGELLRPPASSKGAIVVMVVVVVVTPIPTGGLCWKILDMLGTGRIPFKIGQPKKQIVPKTVERDFEREYGKLQQLEDQTKKLQKDMKKSTDADLAMSKSAVKISSDLLSNPLCEQEPSFLEMVTAFDTAMKRMDSFNQEKVNQIQKTVIEPLKNPGLGQEENIHRKYEEKERTGPVLAKLHQAREELRPVKEDFEAKNKQLLEEMPKFYSSRIDYFKPSFESLVRAQNGCVLAVVEEAAVLHTKDLQEGVA
ncbi:bridging integrator 3 [Egretta garzetta]|uniref:bridging integrator 3 n=1 Tax=Egretta garzetta TaxID=188379 RepID=UPI00163BF788|nr:bridging integrator 3 [Egretta garzetta]